MCLSGISGSEAHGDEAMVLVASLSSVVGDRGPERDLCVGWFSMLICSEVRRWLEGGGNSNWFWLCSGSVAMVVLFGILALVAQFFYWVEIVKGLNDQFVEGSGHRDIG